eukprot:1665914-Amphidinium_carterae.1
MQDDQTHDVCLRSPTLPSWRCLRWLAVSLMKLSLANYVVSVDGLFSVGNCPCKRNVLESFIVCGRLHHHCSVVVVFADDVAAVAG